MQTLIPSSLDAGNADPVRELSDGEIRHYREHGWVHVPGLVGAEVVAQLAVKAAGLHQAAGTVSVAAVAAAFGQNRGLAAIDADFAAVAHSPTLGANASRLLPGEPRVRLQIDNLLVKEPLGGPHHATTFHQDFPWMPMDRSSMLTVWLALIDIPATMGSLRFYDRSHIYGVLGRSFARPGDDALTQHPWLSELELSPPLDLHAGDATIHSALTVHGASANEHDEPRLSYASTYFDAQTKYTGSPFAQTDDLGLTVNAVFDHPDFPLIPVG
jgi:hypothetical protein